MTISRWLLAIAMTVGMLWASPVHARETAKVTLQSTGIEAAARGKASVSVKKGGSSGRFEVTVQKLARETSYDLVVGGIKVLALRTSRSGGAKARFNTSPRRNDTMLGFDPRGEVVAVRNQNGDDVLVGTMPETPSSGGSGDVSCCVPDDDETECEDRTVAECAAAGGTVSTATSCLPDPCVSPPPTPTPATPPTPTPVPTAAATATPAPTAPPTATPRDVVCCLPDVAANEIYCDTVTAGACAADGGVSKGAGMCTADSCLDVPPPNATCADNCWSGFFQCLDGCTTTYCAPFCQVDLGACLNTCPPE